MQRRLIAVLLGLGAAVAAAANTAERVKHTYSFPPVDALPDQPNMPDPFRKPDGSRVATRAEWREQRAYLKALLEHYLYGRLPPCPERSDVSFALTSDEAYTPPGSAASGRKQGYRIVLARRGLTHSFCFNLWRPAEEKRYPVLINNYPEHSAAAEGYSMAEGVRRGYAVVEFQRRIHAISRGWRLVVGDDYRQRPGCGCRCRGGWPVARGYFLL